MGRTNATYRGTIEAKENEWEAFRRVLKRRDQPHFDRLWVHARDHADAGGALNPPDPMPTILMSICLAQERRIRGLEERVAELEE